MRGFASGVLGLSTSIGNNYPSQVLVRAAHSATHLSDWPRIWRARDFTETMMF